MILYGVYQDVPYLEELALQNLIISVTKYEITFSYIFQKNRTKNRAIAKLNSYNS